MAERIRVLIADGDPAGRERLSESLAAEPDMEVLAGASSGAEAVEQAERLRPDVVLVDGALSDVDAIEVTERISSRRAGTGVVILSAEADPARWRAAMRAGARDLLVKPFTQEELAGAVRQVHTLHQRELERLARAAAGAEAGNGKAPGSAGSGAPGTVVALFSPKGGVGRTTLAVNLAASVARAGRAVCLVDGSFQFGDVAIMLDLNPNNGSIAELVSETWRRDPEAIDAALLTHSSGLRVLLAPPSPETAELIQPQFVRGLLETLRERFALVLVDTSNWVNDSTLAVLDTADRILGVMTLEISTIKNMRLFLQLAGSLDYLDKLEIVLNRSDATLGIQVSDAERSLGHAIDHTVVSDGATVVYALNRGVPFSISSPHTRVGRDVTRLAELLLSADVAGPAEVAQSGKRRALLARR